jgi:hypothetical protein
MSHAWKAGGLRDHVPLFDSRQEHVAELTTGRRVQVVRDATNRDLDSRALIVARQRYCDVPIWPILRNWRLVRLLPPACAVASWRCGSSHSSVTSVHESMIPHRDLARERPKLSAEVQVCGLGTLGGRCGAAQENPDSTARPD